MPRPTDPADVAASSAATSSWANSVTDAIQAILADIYGVTNLEIPWSKLTGVPSTFTPAAHASSHQGGADPITAAGIGAATSGHTHSGYLTSYTTPATLAARRVYVGSATPTGASDGDLWFVTP